MNRHTHPVSLVDGREVGPFDECELTVEQYTNPEQWKLLPDFFIGVSAAGEKIVSEAAADPVKYDEANQVDEPSTPDNQGGTA